MAYCTPRDVRRALVPSDAAGEPQRERTGTAADLPDSALLGHIADADQRINLYLRGRYQTPLSPTPSEIAGISRDLAAYYAALANNRQKPISPDDPVRLRYRDAMQTLTDLRDNKLDLDVAPPDPSSQPAGGVTVVNPPSVDLTNEVFALQGSMGNWSWGSPYGW